MTAKTNRNPAASSTAINPVMSNITQRNEAALNPAALAVGTVLLGKYTVTESIHTASGEATLYRCAWNNQNYVAKIYNRSGAIKPEVVETLQTIDSPYVAKIIATGDYGGMTVTILPYYELGSLRGRRFTMGELKKYIIPCINDALHTLHSVGILHKDLKPDNIMLLPRGKGVALIDFGISSVLNSNVSMVVTQSGWTLGYASQEALHGIYLEESDYYSFGITLYELFCGYTPYQNLSQEELAQYLAVQKIPFPKEMPQELQNLITGLTYADITHRHEPHNPNRRWTYQEVQNWLAGKKQNIPGEAVVNAMPAYKFNGQQYTDTASLVEALALNPTEGKKHLTRKLLSSFFSNYDPEFASLCMDAEEAIKKKQNKDGVFWRLLYSLYPGMEKLYWRKKSYP